MDYFKKCSMKNLGPAFQMLPVKKEEDLKVIASRIATFSLQGQVWKSPYLFLSLTSHSGNYGQDSQHCKPK